MPGDQRAAQILDAAIKVFGRKGYQRATTKAIAAEACISEATIYLYFDSKRDLLFATLERLAASNLPSLMKSLEGADERTFVRAIVDDRVRLLETSFDSVSVIFQEIFNDEQLRVQYFQQVALPLLAQIVPVWRAREEIGLIRQMDIRVVLPALAGAVIAGSIASLMVSHFGGSPIPREQVIDQLAEFVLHGISSCGGDRGHEPGDGSIPTDCSDS